MYLPRSTPPSQVQLDLIHETPIDYGNEEERFTTVDLHSSNSARAALEKLQTSAQVLVTTPCLCQTSLRRLMRQLLKANVAITEDIYFWRFYTPDAHAFMSKTPFATSTPREGRFPIYLSCHEVQNNIKSWKWHPRDDGVKG